MDLSKLPKLSQTPPPPEQPRQDPAQPVYRAAYEYAPASASPGLGWEVWLSAVVGLILMLAGRGFFFFLLATLSGQTYRTGVSWIAGPKQGQEVGYFELEGYTGWTEAAIFLFGLAMVFEAVVLATVSSGRFSWRWLVMIALAIAVLATGFNLIVALLVVAAGPLPLTSLLCVAFGAYIIAYEWRLLRSIPSRASA